MIAITPFTAAGALGRGRVDDRHPIEDRQQIIVGVREAVRRVQTDFKRIETTRSARIMAEKQLEAELERLKVGLSTTRFVLDFQRDLATAQGHELRAIVDYNKSLSNLSRHKATTLDRYQLEVS
ncbi:MAG: TolC family protein [Nitrospira sp.]